MTREEAIRQLDGADVAVLNRDFFKFIQAIIMAISALRKQEHRCPCDLCNFGPPSSMRGKPCTMCPAISKQETVTNRNGLNEPLTLGKLRKMDGEPVWVQSPGIPEYGRWAIVEGVGENSLFLHDDFTCHDYGKTWLAYRQKPEEGTV